MVDQNSQFYAILTNVGAAKQANADALGIAWKITHMGVGDANGADPTPDATQTRLINEWRRAPLNQLKVDDKDASIIIAEQVIPADIGGKWIREIGLYDEAGDLVAVANCAPTYKPVLSQGSGRTQVLRMSLVVSSAANVQLKIDPSVVLATREWVTEELARQDFKHSVLAATTANIALSGLQTIDGVPLTAGARVLVKNQTTARDNGLYTVVPGAAWSRCDDANSSAKVTPGLLVLVEKGTVNSDSAWQLVTDAPITLGVTALSFEMAFGRSGVAAGTYRSVQVDKYGRVVAATNPTTVAGYGITDVYTKSETFSRAETTSAIATAVASAVAGLVDSSPAALDTLKELAMAIGNDPNFAATMVAELAKKAPLASPDLMGTPKAPTAPVGTNTTQLATMAALLQGMAAFGLGSASVPTITDFNAPSNTGFFKALGTAANSPYAVAVGTILLLNIQYSATGCLQIAGVATQTQANMKLYWRGQSFTYTEWREVSATDSPVFTGNPTAPTPAVGDNDSSIATTAFVNNLLASFGIGYKSANVGNLDALKGTCFFGSNHLSAGAPDLGGAYDAIGWQVEASGQRTQFLVGTGAQLKVRTDDSADYSGFEPWSELATTAALPQALAAVGLGTHQAPLCADVNAQATSGFFYLNTGVSANMPYENNGFLLQFPWNGTSAALQFYVAASVDKLMYRAKSSGNWRAWKDIPSLDGVINAISNTSRSFRPQAAIGLATSQALNTTTHMGALFQFNNNGLIVTLPSSANVTAGTVVTLRNPRASTQTLTVAAGAIVEEGAPNDKLTLQAYEWVEVMSSGSNWFVSARGKVKEVATVDQLDSAIASATPPGMVGHFARSTPPLGWLKRNGSAISRTAYASLFAVIGTSFGAGDGSTTFNLPDDRELIDRAWTDGLNSADASRVLFSSQSGQLESHFHTGTALSAGAHTHTVTNKREYVDGVTTANINAVYGDEIREGTDTTTSSSSGAHTHTLSIHATGGNETRMANRAYLACIKY